MQRPWLGKSRNMETKARPSAESASANMRSEGMPVDSVGEEAAAGLPRRNSVAMHETLAGLTTRERAIFDAGMCIGAAQQLSQLSEQHSKFTREAAKLADMRQQQAVAIIAALPEVASKGARAGADLGRRVLAAGKALLGKQ